MQSFFNDADQEKELKKLTNTVFKIIIEDLESRYPYGSITSNIRKNLRDAVHKLIKIASEQNKLLLQFPAILAYFVYNFLQNIDLDELEHINEKLDDIQRLIERKNLQGLSFNTIKQILQQELQKRKSRSGEQKEQGEKEEGEQREQKPGEESGESNEQEQEGEESEGESGNEESRSGERSGEGEGEESEGGEGEGEQGKQNSERGQGTEGEGQKGAGEGQGAEDVFEDLERKINDEIMVLDLLEDSLQKALSVLSIGKGSGGGILKEVNPRVLELLERANRILTLANQVDLQYANSRGVKDQGGVMRGVTTGNNLKHLFKSQLILPDEIFLERYTNRALLQRAVESEGVGDFYFIIDKSGSMDDEMPNGYTAFENVSAVALASAMEAEKSNRKVFVQYFDESTTEPIDVNNVLELARVKPGGGTDMMVALREFMEYYNNYPGLKDVKQVFIMSDFETGYDKYTLEDFKNFAKSNDLIITCLHVYDGRVPPNMQEIIDEICDEYYKFNDYDASELFSVVYKKV